PQPTWTIGGRIDGDLDLDSPLRADDVGALIALELRRAGERRRLAAEIEERGGDPIGAEARIGLQQPESAARLGAEDQAREREGIAANVEEDAAANVGLIADIGRILVHVREERLHDPRLADSAALREGHGAPPLRVKSVHERLHDLEARVTLRGVE